MASETILARSTFAPLNFRGARPALRWYGHRVNQEQREACLDAFLDTLLLGTGASARDFWEKEGQGDRELLAEMECIERARAKQIRPDGVAGQRFGDFELIRPLGAGGMGSVWLARQKSLGRAVALKILRAELADSPSAQDRLKREAEALAALRHPGIVPVFGYGVEGGVPWLAMEYVPGQTLADRITESRERAEPLPEAQVLRWFEGVAEALSAAHAAGIVHRDVKPANIIIDHEDRPRLVDFGIARSDVPLVRRTVGFLGSPAYASPEQWRTEPHLLDHRTDLWSLGASLYETLSGRLPFETRHHASLATATELGEYPYLRRLRPDLSPDLGRLVNGCLEPDRELRYRTASDVAADLARIRNHEPIHRGRTPLARRLAWWIRRHPRLAASIIATLVLVTTLFGVEQWRDRRERGNRERSAAEQVKFAQLQTAACEALRHQRRHAERELAKFRESSEHRGLSAEEAERFSQVRSEVVESQLRSALDLDLARDAIAVAERLDPNSPELRICRLDWCFAKWALAVETQDREGAIHLRDLILKEDPGGPTSRRVLGESTLTLTTDPPGAEIYLFRLYDLHDLDPKRESRDVPVGVPVRSDTIREGSPAWRLRDSANGTLDSRFLLHSPDATAFAALPDPAYWTQGPAVRTDLRAVLEGRPAAWTHQPNQSWRPTLIPMPCEPGNRIGVTPLNHYAIFPGRYVAWARMAGHLDRRILFQVPHQGLVPESDGVTRHAALISADRHRPGFQWISCDEPACTERPFWMMESEVTRAQYFEYRRATAGPNTPREPDFSATFENSHPADLELPIAGVSAVDALGYVHWRNQSESRSLGDWEYALPSRAQWLRAHGNVADFGFGAQFLPRQIVSRFTGERPALARVMSHPLDESRWGIYDLAGNVQEWLRDSRESPAGIEQALGGGSWLESDPHAFRATTVHWMPPAQRTPATGFRVVLQPKEGR